MYPCQGFVMEAQRAAPARPRGTGQVHQLALRCHKRYLLSGRVNDLQEGCQGLKGEELL